MENIPTYLSAEEYSKRSGLGVEEVKRLCRNNELEHFRTEKGHYRIKVYNDSIPKKEYEKILKENAELKSTLRSVKLIVEREVR